MPISVGAGTSPLRWPEVSRFEPWHRPVKYLIGVMLMLAVITVAVFLDSIWVRFPAIGVAAGASFVIGTKVRSGDA
jgi:hypothetical protein